ncbi:hypothetical protein K7G98_05175 [Saccharothrix sp. MB29]|nr:hypothetical protein [Saccharothrix sp. MB29]
MASISVRRSPRRRRRPPCGRPPKPPRHRSTSRRHQRRNHGRGADDDGTRFDEVAIEGFPCEERGATAVDPAGRALVCEPGRRQRLRWERAR